ncbi:MAG: MBL fold metallo-hydrolase [Oscillospiraceae bacterium]|nr:MBL fold metallo-hydrolase [Oscillospiraceae bacterium]
MDIKILGSSSKGNCYFVSDGATKLLLDCGLPIKEILKGIDFAPQFVTACLVTHSHGDHVKSANKLAQLYGVRVYASKGCIDAALLKCACIVKSMEQFSVGSWTILPFDVQHDAPEPLGFLLRSSVSGEKLLYFTDTYYLKYRFKGVTHILCEANYSLDIIQGKVDSGAIPKSLGDRIIGSHMSIDHLVDMLKANNLSRLCRIYLCHLSDSNSNADEFKRRVQEATGAEVVVC